MPATYETEQRLRSFLNGNQPQREKMCLALLPNMGNYSSVTPRRPEGGPDGAHDLEALFNGVLPTWGAVGFRNDAGSSTEDRNWAERKFKSDLDSALKEHPTLSGFVFFTNVDLTPGQHESLKRYAYERKVTHVEVFDFHRIRDALDRPVGFIARLQYLDIEMSKDEQLGLVSNFGQELQKTLNSGFSRMERTLERLEKFLDLRKPLNQIGLLFTLDQRLSDITTSPQVIATYIRGLWPASRNYLLLSTRAQQQTDSDVVIAELEGWLVSASDDNKAHTSEKHLRFGPTRIPGGLFIAANYHLSLSAGGGSLHLADVPSLGVSVFASPGIASHITKLQLDMNGYTILCRDRLYEEEAGASPTYVPEELTHEALDPVDTCAHPITHDALRRSSLSFARG